MKTYAFIFLFGFYTSFSLSAQKIAEFKNPSFENIAQWGNGNFTFEKGIDLQPHKFGVSLPPKSGQKYISLVARDNGTWESISQTLDTVLVKDRCYKFSVHLAKSESFSSPTLRDLKLITDFDKPISLQIWGNNSNSSKQPFTRKELLYVSPPIVNEEWQEYSVVFKPKKNINTILLEAYYTADSLNKNGHLLLDTISPISVCNCEEFKSFDSDAYFKQRYYEVEKLIEKYGRKISLRCIYDLNYMMGKVRPFAYLFEIANAFRLHQDLVWIIGISTKNQEKEEINLKTHYLGSVLKMMGIKNWEIELVDKYETPENNKRKWISENNGVLMAIEWK